MYKVLIADDESRILKHLQTLIPWTQLGLELAASVTNGTDALLLAKQMRPNIIVTDIRMPGISGLELCRQLHEMDPTIQIIVISGYADFEYARQAIQFHVLGYCLKPIDEDELTAYLRGAIRNIQKDFTVNGDDLLDSIEEGDEERIKKVLRQLGFSASCCYIAISVKEHNISKEIGAELTLKLGKHKYLYLSSKPLREQAANSIICYSTRRGGIGIWPQMVKPCQMKDAIGETEIMAYQFFINERPTLCRALVEGPMTDDLFKQIGPALQSLESLQEFIVKIRNANLPMLFNLRTSYAFYSRMQSSKYYSKSTEKDFSYGLEQFTYEFGCFRNVLSELLRELDATPIVHYKSDSSPTTSFIAIIRYLNENYEKSITLTGLSEKFHLNPSYISQLIKSETGMTYSQYMTELRIGKAKQLLKTSSMSLSKISEAVGFSDYFYFIKKFKKVVGLSPGKFNSFSGG